MKKLLTCTLTVLLFIFLIIGPNRVFTQEAKNIRVETGYYGIFGQLGDKNTGWLPYINVLYSQNIANSSTAYWELGIGYFGHQEENRVVYNNRVRAVPISTSFGWKLNLGNHFLFNPKMGFGFLSLSTENQRKDLKRSERLMLKPSLIMSYKLENNWFFTLETSLLMSSDIHEMGGDHSVYYLVLPSFGVSLQF
ncbi:MAG: hypothetical protein IEMM0008_0889 [bacterium]|nr:MAG: hypothetical protein IEMM0008_0889 [bacterium]